MLSINLHKNAFKIWHCRAAVAIVFAQHCVIILNRYDKKEGKPFKSFEIILLYKQKETSVISIAVYDFKSN